MIDLSVLRRLSMKGAVTRRKASSARSFLSVSMGLAKDFMNSSWVPRMPGCTIDRSDQYSISLFSTGVPLMAITCLAGKSRTACVMPEPVFLMACASSSTISLQVSAPRTAASRLKVP